MTMPTTQEIWLVRMNLGDIEEPYQVEDDLITKVFDSLDDKYSSEEKIYFTTLHLLDYLIAKTSHTATYRREQEGGVSVAVQFTDVLNNYYKLRDWFEGHPPPTLPIQAGFAGFIFGGTQRTQINTVRSDPNSNDEPHLLDFLKTDLELYKKRLGLRDYYVDDYWEV